MTFCTIARTRICAFCAPRRQGRISAAKPQKTPAKSGRYTENSPPFFRGSQKEKVHKIGVLSQILHTFLCILSVFSILFRFIHHLLY